MRKHSFLLTFIVLAPLAGQGRGIDLDSLDIRSFLIESQIVEFSPNLRRDPFLMPTGTDSVEGRVLLIDDVAYIGRIVFNRRPHAMAVDPTQNTRLFPIGFQFVDGEITQITDSAVVFSQWNPNLGRQSARQTVTRVFKREEAR